MVVLPRVNKLAVRCNIARCDLPKERERYRDKYARRWVRWYA